MPDTIVEPPPSTVPDPTLLGPAGQGPVAPRRGGGAPCLVAALVTLVVVGGAMLGLWQWLFRYKPHARAHIPDRTNLAVRIEAADIALFGPARKHLWPLFDGPQAVPDAGPAASGPSRRERIRKATGIDLATDVREIVVASVDATSWVALVGGRLAAGRFVDGMAQVFHDEGTTWTKSGELLVGPGGFALGQADDGTLVLGTDASIAAAALPATDSYKRLELPERGALVFAVTGDAWQGLARSAGGLPQAEALGRVDHATGSLELGSAPRVELSLRPPAGGDTAALSRDAETVLAAMRLATLLLPDRYGEKEALAKAQVAVEGRAVVVRAPWPVDGLDRACEALAKLAHPTTPP